MTKKKIQWNEGLVMFTFGLTRLNTRDMALLVDWQNTNEDLNDIDLQYLEKLRSRDESEIDAWNEEELKMRYLSFIVDFANYTNKDHEYKVYFERLWKINYHAKTQRRKAN